MSQLQKVFWNKEHNFREYTHPIVRYFSTQRINFLGQFIKLDSRSNILDVGAGEGFSSYYLQQISKDVFATDFSRKMLIKNPVVKKIISDAYALPFRSNSFDMVCAWEVFHHLDNCKNAAEEITRVSKKYICIFEVNRNNPIQFFYGLANKEHRGVLKFSSGYLLRLFGERVRIIKYATTGVIFPNKTPLFLFPILTKIPFALPFFGISNFIICEKT